MLVLFIIAIPFLLKWPYKVDIKLLYLVLVCNFIIISVLYHFFSYRIRSKMPDWKQYENRIGEFSLLLNEIKISFYNNKSYIFTYHEIEKISIENAYYFKYYNRFFGVLYINPISNGVSRISIELKEGTLLSFSYFIKDEFQYLYFKNHIERFDNVNIFEKPYNTPLNQRVNKND
ncbi:MAG: hypothetical protein M0R02_05940 [Bacteroidales bacterium]|nr:hypothetical protein [Bacteroidales bacterium]